MVICINQNRQNITAQSVCFVAVKPKLVRNICAARVNNNRIERLDKLDTILDAVQSVTGVAGDDVPPTSHALPLTNVFRDDVVTPSLTPEQVLAAAPAAEDGRFRVPRILDQEA